MFWVFKRIGISLVLIWIAVTIVFSAIYFIPGDPAVAILGDAGGSPSPEAVARLNERLGLDRPVLDQYLSYMQGLLRGDFGRSLQDNSPVIDTILRRLPRTLELIFAAGLVGVVIGVPMGIGAAVRQDGPFDRSASAVAAVAMATPVFVLGTLLIMLLAKNLKWVPAGGFVEFSRSPTQHLVLLAMPAMALGVGLAATMFRMTRTTVIEVIARDHIRTAFAKGLSGGQVLRGHVIRNASPPVITVLGLELGSLLGGTVLVEVVFNWPGLSGMLIRAVNARDYPSITAVVVVISILFVLLNAIVEILYGVIDPRVSKS